MYHRNKVHTDEFWKYELAKHRRTVLDSKTNEDMWRKQLGKHAAESEDQNPGSRSRSLEIHDRKPSITDERWLEQIKRSTSSDPNQNSQVSAEMKLLALHSLQNSLQMMSMKLPTQQAQQKPLEPHHTSIRSETPTPAQGPPAQPEPEKAGYLSLLAHLSAQRNKAQEGPSANLRASIESEPLSSVPTYLSDMKEESAAKRTQMWLAQLGHYRQKSASFHEDIDRNHEELWEEQIAKVRKHPIKSPLEPIEITIEEEDEEKAILPPPIKEEVVQAQGLVAQPQEQQPPLLKNNVISIKTSAIQRVENQPRTFSLQLEVNNNNLSEAPQGEEPLVASRHIPVPPLPNRTLGLPPPAKRPLLEIPEITAEEPAIPEDLEDKDLVTTKDTTTPATNANESDPGSVLKSLLMDRLPRKRPLSPVASSVKSLKTTTSSVVGGSVVGGCTIGGSGESDILRRRLLGIKSESLEDVCLPPKPKFKPPTATITSQQFQQQSMITEESEEGPVDLRKDEQKNLNSASTMIKNYTQTSVLKHLLYRYTNSGPSNHAEAEDSASS